MKPPDQQSEPSEKADTSLKEVLKLILWFAGGLTLAGLLVIAVMFVFLHAHF